MLLVSYTSLCSTSHNRYNNFDESIAIGISFYQKSVRSAFVYVRFLLIRCGKCPNLFSLLKIMANSSKLFKIRAKDLGLILHYPALHITQSYFVIISMKA